MKSSLDRLDGCPDRVGYPDLPDEPRVEADPNREYVMAPADGPFAILVKAYMGDDAHELANRLVLHLRQNGWPAYVYDYTPEVERNNKEFLDARYKDIPPERGRTR